MATLRSVVIVFVVGLVFFGVAAVQLVSHELAVDDTETVEGVVLDKGVTRIDGGEDPDSYKPWVQYRYEVDGETYVSSNVYPGFGGESKSTRREAEQFLERFSRNETVTVHVAADDPEESFLVDSGFPLWTLLFMGIGAGLFYLSRRLWHRI